MNLEREDGTSIGGSNRDVPVFPGHGVRAPGALHHIVERGIDRSALPALQPDEQDEGYPQGPTKGLGAIRFHDYGPTFAAGNHLPNVAAFSRQIALFKEMLAQAGPDKQQDMDPSFSLPLGEMFAIVVYGQLILEPARLDRVDPEIVNQVFDFMVRDFAHFALQIYGMHACREDQRAFSGTSC